MKDDKKQISGKLCPKCNGEGQVVKIGIKQTRAGAEETLAVEQCQKCGGKGIAPGK